MTQRILTALALFATVVGVLFFDPTGIGVKIVLFVLVTASVLEWAKITGINSPLWLLPSAIACLLSIFSSINYPVYLVFLVPIIALLVSNSVRQHEPIGKVLFSNLWLILTLVPLILLSLSGKQLAPPLILFGAVPLWLGDTAGLFIGKSFGKHPLAPSISPKKTVEGAIGNLVFCVIGGVGLTSLFHAPLFVGLLIGLNCGIIGQMGDLFQSHLKRLADLKDSGSILPGHGGVLDRIDSLMASVPFTLLILKLTGIFVVVLR